MKIAREIGSSAPRAAERVGALIAAALRGLLLALAGSAVVGASAGSAAPVARSTALVARSTAPVASAAGAARDPGRWLLTGYTGLPTDYWQGVTGDGHFLFFAGFAQGIWRTDASGRRLDGRPQAIPADVATATGFNHVGDPGFERRRRRLLLPLECYVPGKGNTCQQGGLAVVDPDALAWRYLVLLDRREIAKAMWVEVSPDSELAWTSSRRDLLAYRTSEIAPARAWPTGRPLRAVRRLRRAVPPSGVTGAAFVGGSLFLAGQDAGFEVWAVDPRSGRRRLEIALGQVAGESEGLHYERLLGGQLHWLIAPLAAQPTFGRWVAMLHFVRASGRPGLLVRARVLAARAIAGGAEQLAKIEVRVSRRGRAVAGAVVAVAGFRARTDRRGVARLLVRTAAPGQYAAFARAGNWRGLSQRLVLGPPAPATVAVR